MASTVYCKTFKKWLSPINSCPQQQEEPEISFKNASSKSQKELSSVFMAFQKALEREDIKRRGSDWTVDHLCKFIRWIPTYHSPSLTPCKKHMKGVGKSIKETWKERFTCVTPVSNRLLERYQQELGQNKYHEPFSRILMDVVVITLSKQYKLIVRFEEMLSVEGFPTSRPNYVIYTQDCLILGCIEAKAVGHVTKDSIVQCILQLFSLHTKAKGSLFGIVTDGFDFIFIVLKKDGTLHLESESQTSTPDSSQSQPDTRPSILTRARSLFLRVNTTSPSTSSQSVESGDAECKIHRIRKWEDLEDVVAIINRLLHIVQSDGERDEPNKGKGGRKLTRKTTTRKQKLG